jgi:hypothetical protein
MCCGYNSLYAIPDMDFRNDPGLPEGKRVWSWLVLCDDGLCHNLDLHMA